MAFCQGETRAGMIKPRPTRRKRRVQPSVKGSMAPFAVLGFESCLDVVDGTGRVLKIPHVARFAGRRKAQEVSDSSALVALIALHHSVHAEQRKAIEVIVDRLHRHVPAIDRMALGAVRSHLAAVNVGVAIGAILAHVGEHRFQVAAGAGNFFVHAAQRIAS